MIVAEAADRGGIAAHLREFAKGLVRARAASDIHLLLVGGTEAPARRHLYRSAFSSVSAVPRSSSPLQWARECSRSLRAIDPAVVHAHGFTPEVLTALSGLVGSRFLSSATIHSRPPDSPWSAPGRSTPESLALWATRRWKTRGLVAVSVEIAATLRKQYPGADEIRVIYNGTVPEPLLSLEERASAREDLGVGRADFAVLVLARLVPEKRVDLAIRAAAEASKAGCPILLLVAGEGPELKALRELAACLRFDTRVRFLGHRDATARLLRAADILMLSSPHEGLPFSALEAMGARLPVLGFAVGGLRELIEQSGGGVLVAPGDVHGLARELQRLASDRALRECLGDAGRSAVLSRFSAVRMVNEYLSFWECLAGAY